MSIQGTPSVGSANRTGGAQQTGEAINQQVVQVWTWADMPEDLADVVYRHLSIEDLGRMAQVRRLDKNRVQNWVIRLLREFHREYWAAFFKDEDILNRAKQILELGPDLMRFFCSLSSSKAPLAMDVVRQMILLAQAPQALQNKLQEWKDSDISSDVRNETYALATANIESWLKLVLSCRLVATKRDLSFARAANLALQVHKYSTNYSMTVAYYESIPRMVTSTNVGMWMPLIYQDKYSVLRILPSLDLEWTMAVYGSVSQDLQMDDEIYQTCCEKDAHFAYSVFCTDPHYTKSKALVMRVLDDYDLVLDTAEFYEKLPPELQMDPEVLRGMFLHPSRDDFLDCFDGSRTFDVKGRPWKPLADAFFVLEILSYEEDKRYDCDASPNPLHFFELKDKLDSTLVQDAEFMLNVLEVSPSASRDFPESFANDRRVIRKWVEKNKGDKLPTLSEEITKDGAFMLELIEISYTRTGPSSKMATMCHENLLSSKEFVERMVAVAPEAFSYVSEAIRADRAFVLALIKSHALALYTTSLCDDEEVARAAIEKNPENLRHIEGVLISDLTFIQSLAAIDIKAAVYLPHLIWQSPELVARLFQGAILQISEKTFYDDIRIIVKRLPSGEWMLGQFLKGNPSDPTHPSIRFCALLSLDSTGVRPSVEDQDTIGMYENLDFMKAAVRQDPRALCFAHPEIRASLLESVFGPKLQLASGVKRGQPEDEAPSSDATRYCGTLEFRL